MEHHTWLSVTDASGSNNFTAAEIATNFNALSSTYIAYSQGNIITFVSERTGVQAGAFSFNAGTSGSAVTIAQQVVGVAETTNTILRADWNIDKGDGSADLPLVDWSKGNTYQIRYQWLGFGAITFYIGNPITGNLIPVHRIQYQNANTNPSLANPSLQFLVNSANASTTENISCYVGSIYGGTDGGVDGVYGNRRADTFSKSVGNTSQDNIVSFRAPHGFNGVSNRSVISLLRLVFTASAAADIKIIKNPSCLVTLLGYLSQMCYWNRQTILLLLLVVRLFMENEQRSKIGL